MRRFWPAALALLAAAVMPYTGAAFVRAFPDLARPVYRTDSFLLLLGNHAALVAASTAIALGLGIGAAIIATRPGGRAVRPLAEAVASAAQVVPPVAVLALAVPALGFGIVPALLALTLYAVLPILRAGLAGLDGVDPAALDAARGIGMTPWQRLIAVEMPLAWPVMRSGARTAAIIGVGTASIAATVGVRSLGTPIVLGLDAANPAYVLQGAILTALLAVAVDRALRG